MGVIFCFSCWNFLWKSQFRNLERRLAITIASLWTSLAFPALSRRIVVPLASLWNSLPFLAFCSMVILEVYTIRCKRLFEAFEALATLGWDLRLHSKAASPLYGNQKMDIDVFGSKIGSVSASLQQRHLHGCKVVSPIKRRHLSSVCIKSSQILPTEVYHWAGLKVVDSQVTTCSKIIISYERGIGKELRR